LIPLALTLVALASIWGAMLWLGGTDGDQAVLAFFYAGDRPFLSAAARCVTELGAYYTLALLGIVAIVLLYRRERGREAVLLFTLIVTGPLFVELQKGWIGRLRPHDQEHLVATQSFAFPSGHTANATLIWLSLALLLARSGRAPALAGAALIAVAVGCSRMMLGVHWPTDVIGGLAFGLFWLLLLFRLFRVPLSPS
jgi:membrane-associated phospholipid phosphatase